jgi:hypothetical protein
MNKNDRKETAREKENDRRYSRQGARVSTGIERQNENEPFAEVTVHNIWTRSY